MGSAAIPKQVVQYISMGYTAITNPILFLKVSGTTYANGYRVNYGSSSYRNYFATYNESTGEVRLYSQGVTYGQDMPAATINNIEVYLAS